MAEGSRIMFEPRLCFPDRWWQALKVASTFYPKMCRRSGWGCLSKDVQIRVRLQSEKMERAQGVKWVQTLLERRLCNFFAVKASCKQMPICCWGLSIKDALLVCYPFETSKKGPLLTVPRLLTMSTLAIFLTTMSSLSFGFQQKAISLWHSLQGSHRAVDTYVKL